MEKLETIEGKRQTTPEAKLVDVPTQLTKMIELENGDIVNELDLLLIMYNKICKIEKVVI